MLRANPDGGCAVLHLRMAGGFFFVSFLNDGIMIKAINNGHTSTLLLHILITCIVRPSPRSDYDMTTISSDYDAALHPDALEGLGSI